MLFTGFFRYVVLICIYAKFIYAQVQNCPEATKIAPCHCYLKTKQIRCEATDNTLDNKKLKEIGDQLKGVWDILYIHKTMIKQIDAATFNNVQFKEIFISNNAELLIIDPKSFIKSTETITLEIRENIHLKKTGLFDVANVFADSLVTIGFDSNDIEDFNGVTFAGTVFKKLESLNLQKQTTMNSASKATVLPAGFINKLTLLKQLSLDSIGLKTITDKAIDLSDIKALHISIFLNNNNLGPNEVTDAKIIFPAATTTLIGLVLDVNGINELTAGNVKLFVYIAEHKGNVYLNENTITTCDCKVVMPLKTLTSNLHFTKDPVCSTDKTIATCVLT